MLEKEENNLLKQLKDTGEKIKYGTVNIEITFSKGKMKKVVIINDTKVVLLD